MSSFGVFFGDDSKKSKQKEKNEMKNTRKI